jgi:hypothetical protein
MVELCLNFSRRSFFKDSLTSVRDIEIWPLHTPYRKPYLSFLWGGADLGPILGGLGAEPARNIRNILGGMEM